MNYEKLYKEAILKYQNQKIVDGTYTEVHHILPKHKGGTDDGDNLIRVTYRQHILLHLLLWKSDGNLFDKAAYLMMAGQIDKIEARRLAHRASKLGKPWTPEMRERIMTSRQKYLGTEEYLNKLRKNQLKSAEKKADTAKLKSQEVVSNAERNVEWLDVKSNRSKYKFVSPEGLVFDSPIFAAKYYGSNVKHIDIENWCKRKKYGWNTIPELAKK